MLLQCGRPPGYYPLRETNLQTSRNKVYSVTVGISFADGYWEIKHPIPRDGACLASKEVIYLDSLLSFPSQGGGPACPVGRAFSRHPCKDAAISRTEMLSRETASMENQGAE